MGIGIILASSQHDKAKIIENILKDIVNDEIINFGCFDGEELSYVEVSILIGLLINSGSVDFVITGCSSGQGMMLACNTMPNVICGYVPTVGDAYLFRHINDGNVVSLSFGLNYGWCGDMEVRYILEVLFDDIDYPIDDISRKQHDTVLLKQINTLSKVDMITLLKSLDYHLIQNLLTKKNVIKYIINYSTNVDLVEYLKSLS
ncbi:MAG: RpiB/LacA/LacB family sugar-phosphate isomerase [Erysipelotrichaceae bacterium]|nr:RpiB/LacA/LacB family sugar-phosphate isomerase [Erysipelotrichaceae bacterium]